MYFAEWQLNSLPFFRHTLPFEAFFTPSYELDFTVIIWYRRNTDQGGLQTSNIRQDHRAKLVVQVRSVSLNWPLFPTRSQILSKGNAWKKHENFRAMSVMAEMTFSRQFSYHTPHMAEFFLVFRDSSCPLTNDENCNWRLPLFCW